MCQFCVSVFADLVNGEFPQPNQGLQHDEDAPQPRDDAPQPGDGDPQPDDDATPAGPSEIPSWCNCGNCQQMPTQIENKCCCARKLPFQQLVLDANVLDIAMRYYEDVLALDDPHNNENFWHAAYRQYILWQYARLGQGNRRVVPSCCVLAIRSRYHLPMEYTLATVHVEYEPPNCAY